MRKYEMTYILRPEMGDEGANQAVEKYNQQITEQGGQIVNVKSWGKQKFAYELARHTEGYYVTVRFDSESAVAEELRRVLRLSEDVLRCMLIVVD